MRKKGDIIFFIFPIFLDALLVIAAFSISYWLRFHSALIPVIKGIPPFNPYLSISIFTMVVLVAIFYLLGLYDTKKVVGLIDKFYDVFKGIVFGIIFVLAATFFYREFTFSRVTIVIACILSGVLILFGKAMLRSMKTVLYSHGRGIRNACIVGTGEVAKKVVEKFTRNPVFGYRLMGQVIEKGESAEKSLPLLGNLSQIRKIVEDNKIDMLILTFPLSEHRKAAKILIRCNGLPVELRFVPDPYEMLTSRIGYYDLDGFTLLGLKEFPLTYWNALLKRGFDVVISALLIAIYSPLILIISVLIKLTSKGPLFYRQERIGKDDAIFDILKFRSMAHDAEQRTGPIFATNNDPRVTRIGHFLRRWSLDEIPQLFNVLKGQMSLVGPRPERPEFVRKFSGEISRYLERHRVRPGITGWAQVNGLRGDTSIKERVKYDLYYIENWDLGLDIKILLRTLGAIIRGENAY